MTGVAVTSGPWLLTTLVLVLMRISVVGSGVAGVGDVEHIITMVYAGVIVLGAPIDIVMSRFAADRVYEGACERIAPPLRRVVAACLLAFTVAGAAAMLILDAPLFLAIPGTALTAVVGAQWLLLSAAGGLSSPGIILRAFAVGAPVSVVSTLALTRPGVLGAAGYLYGFGLGQLVTLTLLLWGTLRALPDQEDEQARILPAFRDYWLLAAAAFAFHAGLWIDKIMVYVLAGGPAASVYAAMAAVAWLSVVPACAYVFVCVETVFHRRFRAYYQALHTGASLRDLESLAHELHGEVGRTLRGAAAVQAGVTLFCLLAAPVVAEQLGLGGGVMLLRWLLLGAAPQILALAVTLLLYYFDFRREAFATALVQLVTSGLFTILVGTSGPVLGAGYALACAVTCGIGVILLHRRMHTLLAHTFQSQPYGAET